jgi:outer membrane protein TolC
LFNKPFARKTQSRDSQAMSSELRLLLILTVGLLPLRAPAQTLGLELFLDQVRAQSSQYRGARIAMQGASDRASEGDLLFLPSLKASAQVAQDHSQKTNPSAQGQKTIYNSYSLGLSQQFRFGLRAQLAYSVGYTDITGALLTFLPQPTTHEGKLSLDLSLPLLRGAFGREAQSQEAAMRAQAKAAEASEAFRARIALSEAELAYLRLSFARDAEKLSRDSLERASKIRDWVLGREKLNLADRSDFLQAEAGYQARALDLRLAQDELRSATQNFNLVRGILSDQVFETLTPISELYLDSHTLTERKPGAERWDVTAAAEAQRASEAAAQLGQERNRPELELFTSLALTGRATPLGDALSQSLKSDYPITALGVRLSLPLAFNTTSATRAGYLREFHSAELKFQRKAQEQERDWLEITRKLNESTERVNLAKKVEQIQAMKFERERERQRLGKTTTYFVLLFEQEYVLSLLNRLRLQSENLSLRAQAKNFERDL